MCLLNWLVIKGQYSYQSEQYSDELKEIINEMLKVKSSHRSSAKKLLENSIVQQKMNELDLGGIIINLRKNRRFWI